MTIQISVPTPTRPHGSGGNFAVKSLDFAAFGGLVSPVALLDDFRVSGHPFGPHPHAGFSQITYVFEDSHGALHSRDSLGNDLVVGPGGIVWTQAGSGMMHQEVPADPVRELHGLQVFVNMGAKNKFVPPRVLHLAPENVPEWRSERGDRVRVVTGSFGGVSSPLAPVEPFDFFDVTLCRQLSYDLTDAWNAIIYVLEGEVTVGGDGRERVLGADHAIAITGGGGQVTLATAAPAHLLFLSGHEIDEPIVAQGPFIMNTKAQIDDAFARYRAGAMGRLAPLPAIG